MVGLDRAVLGGNRRPFDQGQKVTLYSFAADIRTAAILAGGDLVDLVEEDDTVVLHGTQGVACDRFLIEQLIGLLVDQRVE